MEYGEATPGPLLGTMGEGTPPPSSPVGRVGTAPSSPIVSIFEPQYSKNNVLAMPNVQEILARIPDSKNCIPRLLALKFFAITPSGKRVPVTKFCAYAEDFPEDSVLRTLDNRLLTILEAIQPDGTVYWRQAFYMSSGESSEMANTWLPVDGIVFDPPIVFGTETKSIEGTLWFDKNAFVSKPTIPIYGSYKNTKQTILYLLCKDAFAECGLPEGTILDPPARTSVYFRAAINPFDRFGCISYYLASREMGGGFVHMGEPTLPLQHLTTLGYNHLDQLQVRLTERVAQPCFEEFQKSLPFVSIKLINSFISKNKASSYDNVFRQEGYRVPSMQDVSLMISNLGYAVPIKPLHTQLTHSLLNIRLQSILNPRSPEEIQRQLDRVVEDAFGYINYFNWRDPGIELKIRETIVEKYEAFLGGKRRKRSRRTKRVRKGKKATRRRR